MTLLAARPGNLKTTTWRPPRMADLPSWKGAKRIGFDYETKDPDLQALGPGVRRPGNYIVGYSFCIEDRSMPWVQWPKYYVPFRHGHPNISGSTEDNVEGDALGYLRDQMKDFDGELVGANLPYELDWSWEEGIIMPKVKPSSTCRWPTRCCLNCTTPTALRPSASAATWAARTRRCCARPRASTGSTPRATCG
jgi:hypothetical protein